jgi:hypothetical protein
MLRRILVEPLTHFTVIGALLFVVLAGRAGDDADREILVTRGQIESLSQIWQRTWQRPPTQAELEGIIRDHVREEILYREARAMGLDENDSVIRRRLRQKLEFLAEDFAALAEPADADLQAYLDAHVERYALSPRLSFQHVFVSEEKRGADAEEEALELLGVLRDQEPDAAELGNPLGDPLGDQLGDPLPLPRVLDDVALEEVRRIFGDQFADAVQDLPAGSWQGPVRSAFGQHLVFVSRHEPGRRPELAEVRETVRRDWLAEQQRKAREAFYDNLRERYEVTIEGRQPLASDAQAPNREAT